MIKRWSLLLGFAFSMLSMTYSRNEATKSEGAATPEVNETITRAQQPIKIVCVGNSITEGFGNTCQEKAWPGQLSKLLGSNYSVLNCGVSGTTMFKNSNAPYWNTDRFVKAKEANPQILIIALGTNDADPWRWNQLKGEFKPNYLDMVAEFRQNGKDPIIYVCLAPPLFGPDKAPQNKMVETELIPLVKEIAEEIGAYIIDFHQPLLGASKEFPDNVHPDDAGSALMAQIAYDKIKSSQIIQPSVAVTKGEVVKERIAVVEKGGKVTFKLKSQKGNWKWSGPQEFTSTERVVKLENVQRGGTYTATYTDMAGNRSVTNFLISIKGEQGSTLTAQVQDNQGRWTQSNFIQVNPGGNIALAPEVENGEKGSWAWNGPENFFAGTREVRLQTVLPTQAGKYTATYTDDYGRQSSIDFTVAVEGATICPELVPYINYHGWKNVSEMEVKEGDSVTFGPHPSNGGWQWVGPDGFTSDRREATVSNFNSQKAGEYIGTFTNAAGCRVELIITLKLKKNKHET